MENDDDEVIEYDPSLKSLLEKKSIKWVFVGGKGGVGKTTCSSCLAIQLSKVRRNVLLVSTDPAHNLSDAFGQKFSKVPGQINGFTNIFAMEIDPSSEIEEESEEFMNMEGFGMIKDVITSFPGIDEAMSFASVMKYVQTMEFDVIVFDTAPTGHTLRLLSFPATLEKGFGKLSNVKSKFGGLFQQVSSMFGAPISEEGLSDKLDSSKKAIEQVQSQLVNSDLTTFVCVCNPDFLSVYETERLIQSLAKFHIDCENIIVNQILYPTDANCGLCSARSKQQAKYLEQIADLYEDFMHVVKLPLLPQEVRGPGPLTAFSENLVVPYKPK